MERVTWHGSVIFLGALDCLLFEVGALGGLPWEVHRRSREIDSVVEKPASLFQILEGRRWDRELRARSLLGGDYRKNACK